MAADPLKPASAQQRLQRLLHANVLGADRVKVELLTELFQGQTQVSLHIVQTALFPEHAAEKRGEQTRAFRARLAKVATENNISLELAVDGQTKLPASQRFTWFAGEPEAEELVGSKTLPDNRAYAPENYVAQKARSDGPPLAKTFADEIDAFFRQHAPAWPRLSGEARQLLVNLGAKLEPFVQLIPHIDTQATPGFECLAYGPGGMAFGKLLDTLKNHGVPADIISAAPFVVGAYTAFEAVRRWQIGGLNDAKEKQFSLNVDPDLLASDLLRAALSSLGTPPCKLLLEVHESCTEADAEQFLRLKADYPWLQLALDDGNEVAPEVRARLSGKLALAKVDYKTTKQLLASRGDDTPATLNKLASYRQPGIPLVVEGVEDESMRTFLANNWKARDHGELWIQGYCVRPSPHWLHQLVPIRANDTQPCGYVLPPQPRHQREPAPAQYDEPEDEDRLGRLFYDDSRYPLERYVPSRAHDTKLRPTKTFSTDAGDEEEPAEDALTVLHDWRADPERPYCAVLGDYGIGKTFLCRMFAHALLQRRAAEPGHPFPLYMDMRDIPTWQDGRVPHLEEIIQSVLGRAGVKALNAETVLEKAQRGEWLLIFDGLDEKTVHYSHEQARELIGQIQRAIHSPLPPGEGPGVREQAAGTATPSPALPRQGGGGVAPKLLIACRTHYFRDVWQQNQMLTGGHRAGLTGEHYRLLYLEPFDETRIRAYLEKALGEEAAAAAWQAISGIHDLKGLSQRPFLLSLITEQVGDLKRLKEEGRSVNAALLYESVVRSWLDRDEGKHHLRARHKPLFMEQLAARLWRAGNQSIEVDHLEDWVSDEVGAHYRDAYPGLTPTELARLEDDIRTASFLVREGDKRYRFAHTSFQEFFLARYLMSALQQDARSAWVMPLPSRETLDFLGQLLDAAADDDNKTLLKTLESWCAPYLAQASELQLAYALAAVRDGWPVPNLTGLDMRGANLRGWRFGLPLDPGLGTLPSPSGGGAGGEGAFLPSPSTGEGPGEGVSLTLTAADFSHANLREARFDQINLDHARFTAAHLDRAAFQHCRLRNADFTQASLIATVFRHCDLSLAHWVPAGETYRLQRIGCSSGAGCGGLPTGIGNTHAPALPRAHLLPLGGHGDSVNSVAYSPDGRRLASASADHTVRLWDARSGECLAILAGHWDSVVSVAFSLDGECIVSGSADETVRLWDANPSTSQPLLATLEGHSDSVVSVAFSPDGARIASGSADNTVRLWDANPSTSQPLLATLQGHSGSVECVAYSPDGTRIASASRDRTVRLWDVNPAASQPHLTALQGHSGPVYRVTFSPDGARIASGAGDNTVRLWDADPAASQPLLATLQGHSKSVLSVAFSPDGARIASGAYDSTVRLWDADPAAPLPHLATFRGHSSTVYSVAYSPDGARIASGAGDNTVRLWDADPAASQPLLATLQGNSESVTNVAFSPDGARIASGAGDSTLRRWDANPASPHPHLATLQGHSNWVRSVAFSPDGARIASGAWDNTVQLWDANPDSPQPPLATLQGHSSLVTSVAFSPDGARIASGSYDMSVRIWDANPDSTHPHLATLQGHSYHVASVAFSPDGARIASGAHDHTVRLWDANPDSTHPHLATLQGHSNWVTSVAFSPDGARIASGSLDGTVRLWDAATHECLTVYWAVQSEEVSGWAVWHPAREGVGEEAGDQLLAAGGDAWRVIAWRAPDPETGELTRLPIEY